MSLLALARAYGRLAAAAETNAAAWLVSDVLSGEERSLAALERLVKEARDALHALVRGQSRAVTLDTDWS